MKSGRELYLRPSKNSITFLARKKFEHMAWSGLNSPLQKTQGEDKSFVAVKRKEAAGKKPRDGVYF